MQPPDRGPADHAVLRRRVPVRPRGWGRAGCEEDVDPVPPNGQSHRSTTPGRCAEERERVAPLAAQPARGGEVDACRAEEDARVT